MAKVISPIKFRGTIADMTFRITEDGNIAGKKPGPTRERVLSHDNFKRTRLNAAEFQLAIKDAQLLRHSLSAALDGMTGSSLNGRMNGLLYSIAQQDIVSGLGSRRAANSDIGTLANFDFNKKLSLTAALPVRFFHSLDAVNGVCSLEIPSFIARKRKVYPNEATHIRILSGGVAINFVHPRYKRNSGGIKKSELLPLRKKTPGPIRFEHQVEVLKGEVLVQVLGVEFYKLVNGREVLVKGSALKVLEAVKMVTRIEHELHESDEVARQCSMLNTQCSMLKEAGASRARARASQPLANRRHPAKAGRLWEIHNL